MVVLAGRESIRLGPKMSSHPKMNPEPGVSGKSKQHLFPARLGTEQASSRQLAFQGRDIRLPKNPFVPVQCHRFDCLSNPWIPLLSIKFDFRQLRHAEG